MQIILKEVSEKTGISIENLRYYERIALIPSLPGQSPVSEIVMKCQSVFYISSTLKI
ncbi:MULTISPECIES: MerR family DNA-binding transcriptional regulator [Clostridium]|uniref:HTH merR-type domain-containing protein n=1 Tax=Clostridium neonatale TaxID=137838 RepID=A0AA86JSY5_9CLOT|nr:MULTISPECIES: MerR family DNA-binding transcriptional regulator [Clostridium]MDU4476007.1 MerR family DNA-binding transcriptional regulator [Clostridium sp.]CAG9704807.1 hypothetical protein CNEO_210027 [Clostridium neonatale]CAG9711095.1 hypothetical protein CNEO_45071 [Clostridium neonatale]CAG9718034.1 hypothetical protein CNEO_640021 [Clostridium neonatale]CAI3196179.1 hypothetical protein CNEO2_160061 [Clostridium neonatale]